MLVLNFTKRVHNGACARPSELRPDVESVRNFLLFKEKIVLVLNDRTDRDFELSDLLLVYLIELINRIIFFGRG